MTLHDFICSRCEAVFEDYPVLPGRVLHANCFGDLEILWQSRVSRPAAFHSSETTAVYYSPLEKQYQYPGRNDLPVPERLKRRGYEKIFLRSDAEVGRFEKQQNVVNERRHFNSGNGM